MANRAFDWLAQAERDLQHAENSRRAGEHEWACFASHQAAEKAVKALHLHLGQEAWGHLIARLIRELPIAVPEELVQKGMVLDTFYVPARYPNSHPEGAPFEHYGPLQSEEGIGYAREIVAFVRSQMA
jgi:HEPN domain-containing protein